jgi:hypothetical protein
MDRCAQTAVKTLTRIIVVLLAAIIPARTTRAAEATGLVNVTPDKPQSTTDTTRFYAGQKLVIQLRGTVDINHRSWKSQECFLGFIDCHDVSHESSNLRTPAQNPAILRLEDKDNAVPFGPNGTRLNPSDFSAGANAITIEIGSSDLEDFTTSYLLLGYIPGPLKVAAAAFGGFGLQMKEIEEAISRDTCTDGRSPCSSRAYDVAITVDTSRRVQLLGAFLRKEKRTPELIGSAEVLDALTRVDAANRKPIADLLVEHVTMYYPLSDHSHDRLRILELAAQYDSDNPTIANHITDYHLDIGNYAAGKGNAEEALVKSKREIDDAVAAGKTPTPAQYQEYGHAHGNVGRVYEGEKAQPDQLHLEAAAVSYLRAAEQLALAADAEPAAEKEHGHREEAAGWHLRRASALRRIHTREALARAAMAAADARAAVPRVIAGDLLSISADERFLLAARPMTAIPSPATGATVDYASLDRAQRSEWSVAAIAGKTALLTREKEISWFDGDGSRPTSPASLDDTVKSAAGGASGAVALLTDGSVVRLVRDQPPQLVAAAEVQATHVAHAAGTATYAWATGAGAIQVSGEKVVTIPASDPPFAVESLLLSPDAASLLALVSSTVEEKKVLEWRLWSLDNPDKPVIVAMPAKAFSSGSAVWLAEPSRVVVAGAENVIAYDTTTGKQTWRTAGSRVFDIGGDRVAVLPAKGTIRSVTTLDRKGTASTITLSMPIDAATAFVLPVLPGSKSPFTIVARPDLATFYVYELPSGRMLSQVGTGEIVPRASGILTGGRWSHHFNSTTRQVIVQDREQREKPITYPAAIASDGRPTRLLLDAGTSERWLAVNRAASNSNVESLEWMSSKGVSRTEKLPSADGTWALLDASPLAFAAVPQKEDAKAAKRVVILFVDPSKETVTRKEIAAPDAKDLVAAISPETVVYRDAGAVRLKRGDAEAIELLAAGDTRALLSSDGSRIAVANASGASPQLRLFDLPSGTERACADCSRYKPVSSLLGSQSAPFAISRSLTRIAFRVSKGVAVVDAGRNGVIAEVPAGEPLAVGDAFVILRRHGAVELWRFPTRPATEHVVP